jgi:hypothetical protein
MQKRTKTRDFFTLWPNVIELREQSRHYDVLAVFYKQNKWLGSCENWWLTDLNLYKSVNVLLTPRSQVHPHILFPVIWKCCWSINGVNRRKLTFNADAPVGRLFFSASPAAVRNPRTNRIVGSSFTSIHAPKRRLQPQVNVFRGSRWKVAT